MEEFEEVVSSELKGMFSRPFDLFLAEDSFALMTNSGGRERMMKIVPIWLPTILDELY